MVGGTTGRQWLGGGSRRGVPVQEEVSGSDNDDVDRRMPRGVGCSKGVDDPCRSKVEQAGRSVRVVPRAGVVGRHGDRSESVGTRIPHVGGEEQEGCKDIEKNSTDSISTPSQ
jgi:hypothetical protein